MQGAVIFGYQMADPAVDGVVGFDAERRAGPLEEQTEAVSQRICHPGIVFL